MRLALVTAAALAVVMSAAHALQYQLTEFNPGKFVIATRGPIADGDADRLRDFILSNIARGAIVGFTVDSPGGSVVEGEKIARLVRTTGGVVLVPDNNMCASSCFLILAAARTKLAGTTALIGVHSVTEDGSETLAAMGVTTAMARDAAAYGVPASIIGRMVTTEPGRIAWLTPAELTGMGVQILATPGPQPSTAAVTQSHIQAALPLAQPQVSLPQSVPLAPMSMAFSQGKADRRDLDVWFASLSGEMLAGAQFWASQRSIPHPITCQKAAAPSEEFRTGCTLAQQRLNPMDVRRKAEVDYRAGWNG